MIALAPSPAVFYAVVFRGGDVTFVPAPVAAELMQAKVSGEKSLTIDWPSIRLVDLPAIERIEAFDVWRCSVETKVQGDGRWVCGYGTVHGREAACRCMKSAMLPLTSDEAAKALERCRRYDALPTEKRESYDFQSDNELSNLRRSRYFDTIAKTFSLPALPPPRP